MMAKELQQDYLTAKNVYFLVRSSTATIWNGSAFETYVTANYANYFITATEGGTASGFYTANMPAVVTGVYSVIAKLRAGGSPLETDMTIGTGTMYWDGTQSIVPYLPTNFSTQTISNTGQSSSNVTQIDGNATNGNNATLNLKQLNVVNSAGDAIVASSTGSNGIGFHCTGNGTGQGANFTGGSSGNGVVMAGGSSALTTALSIQAGSFAASLGMNISSGPGGAAFQCRGNGSGSYGIYIDGGATAGTGIGLFGGLTSGDALDIQSFSGNGISVQSTVGGHAITILASGASAVGLRIRGGTGSGAAIDIQGSATGQGLKIAGGSTSGDAIDITTTSGHGLSITATGTNAHGMVITGGTGGVSDGVRLVAGTGGVDLRANITGNVTGTITVGAYSAGQDPATLLYTANLSSFQGTAPVSSLTGAMLKLVSKFDAKLGITYKLDGVTPFMTQVVVTDATLVPIRSLGVGA